MLEPDGSGVQFTQRPLAQALGVTKACGWTQGLDIGRDCREMECLRGLKLSVGVGLEETWRVTWWGWALPEKLGLALEGGVYLSGGKETLARDGSSF